MVEGAAQALASLPSVSMPRASQAHTHDDHSHGQRSQDAHLDPDHTHEGEDEGHAHRHYQLEGATRLRSIGIDIGSATSQFAISDLYVGKRDPRLAVKPEVLERQLLHQSPILMTPYREDGRAIDAERLVQFITSGAASAGFDLSSIDTGALICTGEAARKDNAAALSEQLSRLSGRFVCAAAGHHLEAVLGAHGSGAVEASLDRHEPLIAIDVGGGTVKRSLIQDGQIAHVSALNIGTRLIAFDEYGSVTRAEAAGKRIAEEVGLRVEVGTRLNDLALDRIAARMAESLLQFLGLEPLDDLGQALFLTESLPPPLPEAFSVLVSGGFSEYFCGRQTQEMGDLGKRWSAAFRALLLERIGAERIVESRGGIRSTVIGAGQFSLQVSGDTLWLDERMRLPLHGLRILPVPVDWSNLSPQAVGPLVEQALARRESVAQCALAFGAAPCYGYGMARELAASLAEALASSVASEGGLVLLFKQNIARTVGQVLRERLPDLPILCVDELDLGDLQFLDIGERPPGEGFVPVVVKSLVFA